MSRLASAMVPDRELKINRVSVSSMSLRTHAGVLGPLEDLGGERTAINERAASGRSLGAARAAEDQLLKARDPGSGALAPA